MNTSDQNQCDEYDILRPKAERFPETYFWGFFAEFILRPGVEGLRLTGFIAFLATTITFCLVPILVFAEEEPTAAFSSGNFKTLEAEITEVEELKEPLRSAIYTVKDLATGQTLRLFADPYASLIQSGGKTVSAPDVTGGSKATIIYRESVDRDIPEIIFAQVRDSYY